MKWFNHPRMFWESNWHTLPLRRRWYLAIRDPIYVGLWVALIILIAAVWVAV